jgi:hypothetical protein
MPAGTATSAFKLNQALEGHESLFHDLQVGHAWIALRLADVMRPVVSEAALGSEALPAADILTLAACEWFCSRYDPLIHALGHLRDRIRLHGDISRALRGGTPLRLTDRDTRGDPPPAWGTWLKPMDSSMQPLDTVGVMLDYAFQNEPTIVATVDRRFKPGFSDGVAICWHAGATRKEIVAALHTALNETHYKPRPLFAKGRRPTEVIRLLRLYTLWNQWRTTHCKDDREPFYTEMVRTADMLAGRIEPANGLRSPFDALPFPWDDPGKVSHIDTVRKALDDAEALCDPHPAHDLETYYDWNAGKVIATEIRPWGLLG